MNHIYWDTMLFVYWLENHLQYADRVESLFKMTRSRGDSICTSIFTLGEVLVTPLRYEKTELAARIRTVMHGPEIVMVQFDDAIAERYALIRATARVKAADAIHLATAAHIGTTLFVTNDKELHKLHISGISFIAGLDVNLF